MSTNIINPSANNMINPNQFAPLPTAGMCLNPNYGERIEAEFYNTTPDATLTVCTPCKFVAGVSNANVNVAAITADTEAPLAGVLIYDSSKRNVYVSGQYVTLARRGSIVLLTASAAVTANQELSIAPAGTVAPAAASKNVVGIAMNSAAANEVVRVLFIEPYVKAAGG